MSKNEKPRSSLANAGLMLFTLIILAGVAELIFRLDGKYSTFNEKHGAPYQSMYDIGHKSWYHIYAPHEVTSQDLKEYSYSIMANNEGFLDKDFVVEKQSRTIRIMVIGDSFVQGMGAGTDSTCPRLLNDILSRHYGDSLHIEVWNCGIGNSDPVYEYKLLEDRLMKYAPDYVVNMINTTDITDVMMRGGFQRFRPDSSVRYNPPPAVESVYSHSFLARRIMHDLLGYDWMLMTPAQEREASTRSIHTLEAAMVRFDTLCAGHHIPLLVAFLPRDKELPSDSRYDLTPLITYCDSAHILHTDIRPCLQAQGYDGERGQQLYWPKDGHCNGDGYRHVAECISMPMLPYLDSLRRAAQVQ